jgi:hypothetical protein
VFDSVTLRQTVAALERDYATAPDAVVAMLNAYLGQLTDSQDR